MYDIRESGGVSGKSVAAFLFLPQFRECFKGFGHIYPVFMRGLALMFVQSRLLPDDHPAIYYGAQGVPKTSLRDLFGEAWFTLKTTRATTFQYGMFAAIVMMVGALIASVGIVMLKIFFGMGEIAQAQLFSHPCSPYQVNCGVGPGPTDIQTMSAALGGAPYAGLFDSRVNAAGIPTDYALMVLDKILRQAASGTPGTGGALQNALTNLMQVYNSGVLLVAGAVMFWMVLSIVIDSAKTGMFGGGRHNMVWTPIRIVFALGIMIPLGSQGFSSGQYAVMKLAEWGSNFGSSGWSSYVAGVLADDSLLSPFSGNNMGTITTGLIKVMVCQIAHNAYAIQEHIDDQRQWIVVEVESNPRDMWVSNRYTNTTDANVCGTIKYGTSANAATEDKAVMINAGTAGTRTTPMDATSAGTVTAASIAAHTNFKAGLATAISTFRNRMMGALSPELVETLDAALGPNRSGARYNAGGQANQLARQIACQFVAARFGQPGAANNPVGNLPTPINHCGPAVAMFAETGGFTTPSPSALTAAQPQALLDRLMQRVAFVYDGTPFPVAAVPRSGTAGSAKEALYNYITSTAGNGMMAEMRRRGWAGMGMWYLDIAQLNAALQAAREPVVTVEAGTVWTGSKGGFWSGLFNLGKCAWRWFSGNACRNADLEEKVTTVMTDYDRWWGEITRPGATGRTTNSTQMRDADLKPANSSGLMALISFIKGLVTADTEDLMNWLLERIWPRADNVFFFDAVDSAATNTYPLALLTDSGHKIMWTSIGIFVGLTLLQILFCAEAAGFSAGCGLAVSAFANGLSTVATTMMIAGMMVAFYLPVLPFIRVAFAVLTWMVSVFEAVVMVPIAALAHLTTEGDGLTGGSARTAWILWLNVLMRPILVVFGFVGAMLIFNTFAVYFHASFSQGAASIIAANTNPIMAVIAQFAYTVIYLGTLYTAANSSFKLMDLLPNAAMRWMGGSADHSMDDDSDGMMLAATQLTSNMAPKFDMSGKKGGKGKGPGTTNS